MRKIRYHDDEKSNLSQQFITKFCLAQFRLSEKFQHRYVEKVYIFRGINVEKKLQFFRFVLGVRMFKWEPIIDWMSTPSFSIESEKKKKLTSGKGVAVGVK